MFIDFPCTMLDNSRSVKGDKYMWFKYFLILSLVITASVTSTASDTKPTYALVIHGGAGTITPKRIPPELEAKINAKLTEAIIAGETILKNGGSALDAVTVSIQVLENSEYFNAGKGAVFAANGKNELDSSIMDGATLNSGAVSGVSNIKNPIILARAVMEKSRHVMLQGKGAEEFAALNKIETAPDEYFFLQKRWDQLQRAKKREAEKAAGKKVSALPIDYKYGTVGAVAYDKHGNLAAGTSTGGMTNKAFGRVGDSPIIGAGTYANNTSCAVSGTGHGEFFIRATVARSICALMEYAGLSLEKAAHKVVKEQLVKMGGSGGIIAIDKNGTINMTFNSKGMFRASVANGGEIHTAMFEK